MDEPTEQDHDKIAVYGATGYTGGLVCEELARRGVDFVAAGRNFEKLQRRSAQWGAELGCVPTLRQARTDHPGEMDRLLEYIDILINCAGPFTEVGRPVVRAAVRNGCHYLDTTGEQTFIQWVRDEMGPRAAERDLVLMPGCAFEYATGTLAAAIALEDDLKGLGICYAAQGMNTSPGTKRSIVRSISQGGVTLAGGRLVERKPGKQIFEVAMPDGRRQPAAWFPGGEPFLVPEFADIDTVETCLLMGRNAARVIQALSDILPTVVGALEPVADRIIDLVWGEGEGWDDSENAFQVVAFEPEEGACYAAVSGYGPYLTTSRIITETACRLHTEEPSRAGFAAVPALYDAESFAEAVGLDVMRHRN